MDQAEQVMSGLWELFNKKVWLDSFQMKDTLKGYKPSEIHCIDYVGKNPGSNVTKLAEAFYMTRGAISKLTKKLTEKGLLETYQKPDNRKEIYFRLTQQGKVVYQIHDVLHTGFQQRDKAVFDQTSSEIYDAILEFVTRYNHHLDAELESLGVDLKAESYDKL